MKSKLINDYLSKIPDIYKSDKEEERERFNMFYNLPFYSNDSIVQSKLKINFLKKISMLKNKNITHLETFYLSHNSNFGNGLIVLNNVIFYCEVVGCQKIILYKNQTNRKWLIKNPIYVEKSNLTIMQGSNVDCNRENILCIYETGMLIYFPYFPAVIIPQVRTNIIKKEILNNLPNVNVNPNDLYIHIRGGDIFTTLIHNMYAQPPLCFYKKIIDNWAFNNIYIISMDRSNIIVNTLISNYKNIIHNTNNIEYDISILCHAYNIVASVSSFVFSSIKLNDNLKELWEYDMMRLSEKFLFLHHHISKFNIRYKIHTMQPSDIYLSKMFSWNSSPEQLKLMLEVNCTYDFILTKPNL